MPERDQPDSMYASEPHSELNELIRSSIATYGEPAPNSELAQRILVRIASEAAPAVSRRWLPWAVALPIAACLITFFVLIESKPVHTPAGLTDQAHIPAQSHNNVTSATPYQTQRRGLNRLSRREVRPPLATAADKTQSLPKLEVFPTPQSLSPAEQALVEFVSRAPTAERKSLIEAQQQPEAPLTVVAIKIQPIELPERGMN